MKVFKVILLVLCLHLGVIAFFLILPGCNNEAGKPAAANVGPIGSGTAAQADMSASSAGGRNVPDEMNAGIHAMQPPHGRRLQGGFVSQDNAGNVTGSSLQPPRRPVWNMGAEGSRSAEQGSDEGILQPLTPAVPVAAAVEEKKPAAAATHYTVRKGDSLWGIAKKHHVSRAALLELNHLTPESALRPGQQLLIPASTQAAGASAGNAPVSSTSAAAPSVAKASGTVHEVHSGDSLSTIAKKYGVRVADLRSLNHLRNDSIRVGQKLSIPAGGTPGASTGTASQSRKGQPVAIDPSAETHVVRPGETLAVIARRYGVSVADIMKNSSISDPRRVQVGQTLVIRQRGVQTASASAVQPAVQQEASAMAAAALSQPSSAEVQPAAPAAEGAPTAQPATEGAPAEDVKLLDDSLFDNTEEVPLVPVEKAGN